MSKYLDGFPHSMTLPVFEAPGSSHVNSSAELEDISLDSVMAPCPEIRIGFFSERKQPVLDVAVYLATPNRVIDIGTYAPIHHIFSTSWRA